MRTKLSLISRLRTSSSCVLLTSRPQTSQLVQASSLVPQNLAQNFLFRAQAFPTLARFLWFMQEDGHNLFDSIDYLAHKQTQLAQASSLVPQNLAQNFLFRVQIGLPYPPAPYGPLSGPTDLTRAHL